MRQAARPCERRIGVSGEEERGGAFRVAGTRGSPGGREELIGGWSLVTYQPGEDAAKAGEERR